MTSLPPDPDSSGMGPDMFDHFRPYHQPTTSSSSENAFSPSIKLQHVSLSSASLLIQIPKPYSKMYILVQYNQSFVSVVRNLKNKKEMITLNKLKPNTNYTFCVASIRNSQRYNHTCLYFSTRAPTPDDLMPPPSTTTHYIMTIVGCLFGMLIILGFVYYCLRRRRRLEEKEKSICVKKTILEMRYGPEVAAAVANDPTAIQKLHEQSHHHSSRLSSIPQVEKMATAFSEAMASKGNYMDIRTSVGGDERGRDGTVFHGVREEDLREDDGSDLGDDSDDDGRGSASEISTIAMEVDKVNQIINNCIDALKLDSVATSTVSTTASGGGFVSPPYRPPPPATAVRPIQRQMSADAAVIVSSSKRHCRPSSGKGRVYSLDVPEPHSPDPCQYPDKGSPLGCGEPLERLPLVGSGGGGGFSIDGGTVDGMGLQQHLEVHPDYHCAEHRHSVPALYYEGSHDSPAQKVSFLKPLSRTKRDAASYSQLSPRPHNYSGYSSSPEYSSESTLRIWERFRPHRKGPHEESCYVTAGNALRKKVQFAKGEDLHDILDYWKGVSAQQKL
uniref:Extracellular leucine rich repeat and fibronectin type III domain containing 2 n=1 Tax=Cyprinus carpio TaxID=7962 RepID=A0A8C2FG11_CYPCA